MRTGLLPHTQATAAASAFKAPTSKDIPPVTLTNVPNVPPENFQDYLRRIGPLFETCQRGRAEPESTQWLKKDVELEKTDRFAEALDRRLSRDGPTTPVISRQSSMTVFSPTETPTLPKRRSSLQHRRNRNEPTPLSTIPNVYFDENFHLENPRTFDIVSEHAEIVRSPLGGPTVEHKAANGSVLPPRKALATNAILQEKLSWYMDTVEVHLINNISTASTGFFTALGSLKDLQTEAQESITKIQGLREELRTLDREVALSGLEVAATRRRRDNVRKLRRATAQVQSVVESVKRTDELVDEGLFDQAANQMDKLGRKLCGEPEPNGENEGLIDLRPLKALQGLDSGLQELHLRIGSGFAQRFTTLLLNDLRQHAEKVTPGETLKRWSRQRGVPPTYMETTDQFRKDLLSSLNGLARASHTAPATAAYREAVQKEMKTLIRKRLPSSSDDDADSMVSISTRGGNKLSQQEKSAILARNLRALDADDSEQLLIDIYTSIGEVLRRVSTQVKVLLDVTSSMGSRVSKSPSRSPALPSEENRAGIDGMDPSRASAHEEMSQALDMSSLLEQAVDTAQTQIIRVLKVRNEQSIRMPKEHFLRHFTLNRLFADECEAISGRGGNTLRGVINAQIAGFVQVLGTAEAERVAGKLDNDSWNAQDFSESDDLLLQRILASMSSDPPEWTKGVPPIWEPAGSIQTETSKGSSSLTNGTSTPAANGTSTPPPSKTQVKPAYIDGTRFLLVPSVTALLTTIDSFLSLTAALPSMTSQISTCLLEVLRTFNSRSCQLILGAGATRSAGLKNITTKHLALASQALSFIVALVPYMRECVRRHVPSGQTSILADFDKTKRLYLDHQSGIHDKLVEIMTSRSQAHVKAMNAINFDTVAPTADNKPSAYMETLTKETLTLHRVLSRHLNEVDIRIIMLQIFDSYRTQWTKAFTDTSVTTDGGGKRLLLDADCLNSRLGKIEGFEDIGTDILEIVEKKRSSRSQNNDA